ncbi:MAG: phosphatase PAP2 family protein, partial [Deferrisomatales bacterium]
SRFAADAAEYARAPLDWSAPGWWRLGLAAVAVAGASLADDDARRWARDARTPATRRVANAVRGGGELLGWGGAAAGLAYLGGAAAGNDPLRETGFELAEAAALSAGASAVLKVAVGRSRPGEEDGSGTFRPLRGGVGGGRSSFPSFHSALAFSLASVAAERVHGLGWLTYPLAGLVALSRVHDGDHWLSDTVGGAALGAATGWWVAARTPGRVGVVPWAEADAAGLALGVRF